MLVCGVGGLVSTTAATVTASSVGAASPATTPTGSPVAEHPGADTGGPAALVDPDVGTGVGPVVPGNVSEYPGASVPLGMVQFSPDTWPDRQVATGAGYDYADSQISGFSLTHLSGPGCAIYGDIPILPVDGGPPSSPDNALQPFSHSNEHASAGNYAVRVGPTAGPTVGVRLTATTRTALGQFTFPSAPSASPAAASEAGDTLLFKVSDSAAGSSGSEVRLVGDDELTGSVTSGNFCGIPGNYTLYFVARFSTPFVASGTWQGGPPGPTASCTGTADVSCGAWVSFRRPGETAGQTVVAKVGVSYVSAAGAAGNLATEDPGRDFERVSQAATAEWNGLLGRIGVQGGTTDQRRIFYTALYHSLLFPSVFSDDDGRYIGFDHRVHTLSKGDVQYANFSEGDIYRSEVPLLAMLLPGPTSQMVQSLRRDGSQTKGGFLPRWAIADNDAAQWDGDSADAIIADAYAYGARHFDVKEALAAMVHGATVPENNGLIVERQNLVQYKDNGWVPQLSYDVTSYPYTDGGSETLEYAVDDFSIAQVAKAAGDSAVASTFARRGQNWQNLFDPATGYLAARQADGSFPPGPAFQPASPADQAQGVAQQGFEEGNAVQYTWAVPQNLAGLIGLMGGDQPAVAKLDTFFTQLNATRFAPYDWAGNEPGEWVPFDYDYAGQPWATQYLVRRIMTKLYGLTPAGEPGNDDLGALSSWYVWSALGLYPETPGAANLVMASPLFPEVRIAEGNGRVLTVTAAHAPDQYIHSAHLTLGTNSSANWDKPWIPATALAEGANLAVDLGTVPDKKWGTSPTAVPPSFGGGAAPAVGFTVPGGAVTVDAHASTSFTLGVQEERRRTTATPVTWHVASSPGTADVSLSPSSGTIAVTGDRATVSVGIDAGDPGTYPVTFKLQQGSAVLPSLTVDVVVSP